MAQATEKIFNTLQLIRFSHTVFALPFALAAMVAAAGGLPGWQVAGLILLCMVAARTGAMAFNRYADWEYDKDNPRTEGRQHLATRAFACALAWGGAGAFVAATWFLNPLCFLLSPLAVGLIFFYSLTKRFTSYSHAFLGLALAVSPMGAWAAVRGSLLELPPWVLAAAVLFWVFGFDLIYATQDEEHDRRAGLHSFPARYGAEAAKRLAKGLHLAAWLLLGGFGAAAGYGRLYAAAWIGGGCVLAWEHRVARKGDAASIQKAFFWANAIVGALVFAGVAGEVFGASATRPM